MIHPERIDTANKFTIGATFFTGPTSPSRMDRYSKQIHDKGHVFHRTNQSMYGNLENHAVPGDDCSRL
jgi:hypothetical protein